MPNTWQCGRVGLALIGAPLQPRLGDAYIAVGRQGSSSITH
jgi:hypothetical protein